MLNIAIWSQVLVPGKRIRVIPEADFRLTQATLGEELADPAGRTTIKLYRIAVSEDYDEDDDDDDEEAEQKMEFEKEPVILTHLTAGRAETQILDLVFTENEPVEFEISGKNTVHLVGNYIEQVPFGDDSDDDEEGDYDLNEVSSDVEIDPRDIMMADDDSDESADETHGKIEEVVEPVSFKKDKAGKKRGRESETAEVEVKEKKEKKQKTENGAAKVEEKKEDGEKKEKKEKKDKKEKKKGQVTTTKSGVTVDVRKKGDGPAAKSGQKLSMRYIGKLASGKVFDKNTSGKPFSFTLGKGEVIKGWDEGLAGLSAGSEAILTIPPSAAYGNKKSGDIPPNSTLTFEVKVLSIA